MKSVTACTEMPHPVCSHTTAKQQRGAKKILDPSARGVWGHAGPRSESIVPKLKGLEAVNPIPEIPVATPPPPQQPRS